MSVRNSFLPVGVKDAVTASKAARINVCNYILV